MKTFGGRASGPEPLEELFAFAVAKFKGAAGRKLNSIECHDLMCKIGDVVVSGGVRRSAMISLSNLSDDRMRHAKSGQWWENEGYRALSNNSVAYTETPDVGPFMREWESIYESKSGERGIFNRIAAKNQVANSGRRDTEHPFGTNPCSEIILRPYQFCNLTEIVVRSKDTPATLKQKAEIATILGTWQSTLTYLPYLRKIWTQNTEEERLLGVSLTGIMDHARLPYDEKLLEDMKNVCIKTNQAVAKKLGINPSTAITCVKPSGTVSQLVDSASGIHPRHSRYYIRSVRGSNDDPITRLLKDSGVPNEPDVTAPNKTTVFYFPVKSPTDTDRNSFTAIEHLSIWKRFQDSWCEHKPSITVTVREKEWPSVGGWVYDHFDELSGVAFLPHTDHNYKQAPYQEVSKAQYEKALVDMPKTIDWDKLSEYEQEDNTVGSQSYACSGDACEIVDLT